MTWYEKPMLSFDLETDGPDPQHARIISASVGIASPTGWQPVHYLCQPERPIPEEATAVHGITTAHAEQHGQPRNVLIPQIRDALHNAWAQGFPVIVFNAVYDLTLLDRELARINAGGFDIKGPVIDPLVLDKHVDKWRRGSRKLVDVAAHYGITLDEAHDANADSLAAARVAWTLGAKFPTIGTLDLLDLHELQVVAFKEQRESFAAYRRQQGQPLDDESTDWPIKPRTLI